MCEPLAKVRVVVRQAHHEWNNLDTAHPELVEGCFLSFARGSFMSLILCRIVAPLYLAAL